MAKPNADLVKHFRRLTSKQKENIRFHLRRRTPIVCSATVWTDGNGGGWPAVLASTREVPKKRYTCSDFTSALTSACGVDRWAGVVMRMNSKDGEDSYIAALSRKPQAVVRASLREALKSVEKEK